MVTAMGCEAECLGTMGYGEDGRQVFEE